MFQLTAVRFLQRLFLVCAILLSASRVHAWFWDSPREGVSVKVLQDKDNYSSGDRAQLTIQLRRVHHDGREVTNPSLNNLDLEVYFPDLATEIPASELARSGNLNLRYLSPELSGP